MAYLDSQSTGDFNLRNTDDACRGTASDVAALDAKACHSARHPQTERALSRTRMASWPLLFEPRPRRFTFPQWRGLFRYNE
jgi:hypothetical protein